MPLEKRIARLENLLFLPPVEYSLLKKKRRSGHLVQRYRDFWHQVDKACGIAVP